MTEREYWYWISNINGIGQAKIKKLLDHFGSLENIFKAGDKVLESDLKNIIKLSNKDIEGFLYSRNIQKIVRGLDQITRREIRFIHIGAHEYPLKLRVLNNPPNCLYIKGKLPDSTKPSVAMVGSRACSQYGQQAAVKIAGELTEYGVQIISGLARGIDSYSMWGAINKKGQAFGILGCGVDICYPKENIELFEKTKECGGVISEYSPDTAPKDWHFPMRNRIISGLADSIIVVEAKEKSGSLITAEHGLEQGKDIYAVPGRITDVFSKGCNRLIHAGAGIVTNTKEIMEDLKIELNKNINYDQSFKYTLAKDLEVVYSCVDLLPKNIQMIVDESGYEYEDVIRAVVQLQLMNLIMESSKGYFILEAR